MRGDLNGPASAAPWEITLGAMFRCWLMIGVTGFGGVLPVVVHELVQRRRWMTYQEFSEVLAICQILPGPNIVNISVIFGMRLLGWPGALSCLGGLLVLPVIIALALASIYAGVSDVPAVQRAVGTIASAAAGLLIAVALRLLWPERANPVVWGVGALVIALVTGLRVPLLWVILGCAPLSIGLYLWRARSHA